MKKIICLIESLGSGGAERQMSGLAVLLKEQGYDVEVWTYYPNDFYVPTLQNAGVPYRYIAEAQSKKNRTKVLRRELKKAKPDTVIAYLDTACMVACIIKALGTKFKLIVSERNTTQRISKRERIKFFLYRFADWIVPNSHTQAEFITTHYPNLSRKVRCITNFVDTDKFVPIENYVTNEPLRILTVARIMPQKNILKYLDAIKLAVDGGVKAHFDWVGQSLGDDYQAECNERIRVLGLGKYFTFHERDNNIINWYHNADVLCMPSSFEGFPNVICEAMCCGLPIICSNVSDNSRIIDDGKNGFLFDPNDTKSIAKAITHITKCTPQSRSDMRLSSLELSCSKFSARIFIREYIKLI